MVGEVRRTIGLGRRRATLYADYEAALRRDLRGWAKAWCSTLRRVSRSSMRRLSPR